jgi:hypothetical protein
MSSVAWQLLIFMNRSTCVKLAARTCGLAVFALFFVVKPSYAVDGILITARYQSDGIVNIQDSMPGKLMRYDIKDSKVSASKVLYAKEGVTSMCLSPFGDRVAFTKADGMIAVMGLDGGPETDLVRFTGTEKPKTFEAITSLQWPASEGGRWIYYLDGRGGRTNDLRRVNVETKADELVIHFNRPVSGRFALSMDATPTNGHFVKRTDNLLLVIYDLSKGDGDLFSAPRYPGCGESISPDGSMFTANARMHTSVTLVDMSAQPRHEFRLNQWEGDPVNPEKIVTRDQIEWAWQHFRWSVNSMNWIAATQGKLRPGSTFEVQFADAVLYDWVNQQQINVTRNPAGTFDRAGGFWQTGAKEGFLGYFSGKAPFTVNVDDPRLKGDFTWDFGDKSAPVNGRNARHRYTAEGTYALTARKGDQVFRGQVNVLKRRPPYGFGHYINERTLLVDFDEAVQAKDLRVFLASDVKVNAAKLNATGRRLVVHLAEPLRHSDRLHVDGIQDCAQEPNALADRDIAIKVPAWPANREGLVFLWDQAKSLNAVADSSANEVRELRVTRDDGVAGVDRYGRMRLEGGRLGTGFFSKANAQMHFRDVVLADAFSLEATIQPADLKQHKPTFPTRIVNCGMRHDGDWEFLLGQQNDRLLFSIRTTDNMLGLDGSKADGDLYGRAPLYEIATLPDTAPHHVIVSYVSGRLVAYLDGKKCFETDKVTGSLKAWGYGELYFGDNHNGGRHAWRGKIEGVAIYRRFVEAEEAKKNHAAIMARLKARKVLPQIELEGKLLATSRIPELREIAPYRDALVINEFAVGKVVKTSPDWKFDGRIESGQRIRVAQWGMVDGIKTNLAQAKIGQTYRLVLEVLIGHPEKVEEIDTSNSLPEDFEVPILYEPRP